MWPFNHLRLGLKLVLLAGVPITGALVLSVLIARDARERAASAAGLGSIQDLAELTVRMTDVIHELQMERAESAHSTALGSPRDPALEVTRKRADAALAALDAFLAKRDLARLPPRLAHGLESALGGLKRRPQIRARAPSDTFLEDTIEYYGSINQSLINATAALTQLSDDADLLRSISALVAAMEVKERASREHALVAHVFAQGRYPPGLYRYYVALLTQEAVYIDALRNSATEEQYRAFQAIQADPAARKAGEMRKTALEAVDDAFGVDSVGWFRLDGAKIEAMRKFERDLASRVEQAAALKIAQTRRSLRVSATLVGAVIVVSLVLAWLIARDVNRSVRSLGRTAATVKSQRDYSIRAAKTSWDELGVLTDTFNEMLAGIQARDHELEEHRHHLELLVAERTKELSQRNQDMRLVLDHVDQGLVTIARDGCLATEHSLAFARYFGAYPAATHFAELLAQGQEGMELLLRLGFAQILEEILPLQVAVDQMPRELVRGESHYALAFKPLVHEGRLERILLIVSDITAELQARAEDAVQREQIKTFERVMRDRAGFVEFFHEARGLVERIRDVQFAEVGEEMRAVHTLKGSAGLFDVLSVAQVAHRYEQWLVESESGQVSATKEELLEAWDAFACRVVPVLGEDLGSRVEVSHAEVDEVLVALRTGISQREIERLIQRLRFEPMRLRFDRIAAQLRSLSHRFGKGEPLIVAEPGDVRLPPAQFGHFWSAFAHVVRNVVDHGFEPAEARLAAHKPSTNCVQLRAIEEEDRVTIEIADDGRGIDWRRIRELAEARGLPARSRDDLTEALLAPGLSTAESVSSISGRGVGMTEVASACRALGGTLHVDSEPGRGSRFRFSFPMGSNWPSVQLPLLSLAPVSRRPPTPSTATRAVGGQSPRSTTPLS